MPTTLRNTDILFNNGTTQSTAFNDSAVLNACAAASVGAVGTYAILRSANTVTVSPGGTKAGSNLRYATTGGVSVTSPTPAGTWRCMGYDDSSANPYEPASYTTTTVWLRIS